MKKTPNLSVVLALGGIALILLLGFLFSMGRRNTDDASMDQQPMQYDSSINEPIDENVRDPMLIEDSETMIEEDPAVSNSTELEIIEQDINNTTVETEVMTQ